MCNKTPQSDQKNSKALVNRKRTLSRVMAIQIFYQFEFHKEEKPIDELKDALVDHYLLEQEDPIKSFRKKVDLNLLESLLNGIQLSVSEIDHDVSGFLKDSWDLDTIPDIMLYILRFGSFELKYMTDVPVKVVIDEYVDIGASFFELKKVTFLNGILENLAKTYRAEEFEKVRAHPDKPDIKIDLLPTEEETKPKAVDPKLTLALSNLKKSIKND